MGPRSRMRATRLSRRFAVIHRPRPT
jgi:hypothetical protein